MRTMMTVAAVAVMASATAAVAQTKWDMPTAYPDSNFQTQNVRWFAEEMKKASNGKFEIVVHSGASLFKMPEIKRAVQTGQVPIGELLISAYGNEDPIYEADGIPFLAAGYDAAWKLYEAQRPILNERLQKQGMRLLYSVAWPGQGIYSKPPVNSLADLKGVKFRAYNAATARLAELVGAVPTTVQQAEVSQAFATNIVTAMVTSSATGVDVKAWEFSSYYYDTSAMHPRNVVMVNERAFRRLPSELQSTMMNIAGLAEQRGWDMSRQVTEDTKKRLAEGGMKVLPPSPALQAEFQAIGKTMIGEWVKKAGPDGETIAKKLGN